MRSRSRSPLKVSKTNSLKKNNNYKIKITNINNNIFVLKKIYDLKSQKNFYF